jgi:hypothetical protein
MAHFVAMDSRANASTEIDFADVVTLLKGSVISSMAAGDGFIELGVSARTNVRFQTDESGDIIAVLVSTLNPGEIPPQKIALIVEGEQPAAYLIEARLHAMRQLYAINLLLSTDRAEVLAAALVEDSEIDLEKFLLDEE